MKNYSFEAKELLSKSQLIEIKGGRRNAGHDQLRLAQTCGSMCTSCLACISCTACTSSALDVIIK